MSLLKQGLPQKILAYYPNVTNILRAFLTLLDENMRNAKGAQINVPTLAQLRQAVDQFGLECDNIKATTSAANTPLTNVFFIQNAKNNMNFD